MRSEKQDRFGDDAPVERQAAGGPESLWRRQSLRGVAGQLRPYCDVRAGFAPWRRLALAVWAARDESVRTH